MTGLRRIWAWIIVVALAAALTAPLPGAAAQPMHAPADQSAGHVPCEPGLAPQTCSIPCASAVPSDEAPLPSRTCGPERVEFYPSAARLRGIEPEPDSPPPR